MAMFESLPTELLREILDCLEPVDELTFASRGVQVGTWTIHHCQRTLAAVARTCRRLKPIVDAILYCRYEALYQEPAVGYIERFDADPLVRRRLRHVKITKPTRDIFEKIERESYKASQPRVKEFQKTFLQIDPFRYGGRTLELVTKENPELVEVANLIIRAENLETLELEPPHLGIERESPTSIPFFNSTFCLKEGFPSNPNLYSTLRSLTLDMNNTDQPAMFVLLHFPALRELRLHRLCERQRVPLTHGDDEMHEHLQVVAGASKVNTLELQDATTIDGELVLDMVGSCKALERFLLSEKVKMLDHEGVRQARPTYQSILNGLLRSHSTSLKYLELSPDSTDPCIDRCSEDILTRRKKVLEYPRLESFVGFTALEELRVPMPLLTGRPKGESIGNTFESETWTSWESYIDAERLLPPTLTKLSLTMGPVLSPALGWEYSDLLDFITRHNRITHLNVVWKYYMYQEQLPIDFYNLKRGRASFDCKFDYLISVRNLSHNPNQAGPGSNKSALDERLDSMAEWLATYGEAGIEMALHFVDGNAKCVTLPRRFVDAKCVTLPRRVMESLNLPPDWQSSDEAKEILFGQKLDLDATYTANWGLDMLQRQRNMKIWLTDLRDSERRAGQNSE